MPGRRPPAYRALRIAAAALLALLAACVSVPPEPRALFLRDEGDVQTQSIACATTGRAILREEIEAGRGALDPQAIRVLTWNIHKEEDAGWQDDLAKFVQSNDIVLLQEVTLNDALRRVIENAKLRWILASSFAYGQHDVGVLTAARVAPIANCTQRAVEPLLRIPKSAVVSWFRLADRPQTLAVVNVHAINFSVLLASYREQLESLAGVLESHQGPIIFAGDFNTWREARMQVVAQVAARLGLKEV